jgi:hypothetical protein
MKKLVFVLPVLFLFSNLSFGQLTRLGGGYDTGDKTSLGIATSVEEAVALLEKVADLMVDEKEYSFGLSRGFSSSDTLLELVRIDYERYHPEHTRYVANLSKGLTACTYSQLMHSAQAKLERGHYIYDRVYGNLLPAIGWLGEFFIRAGKIPIGQEQEYLELYDESILLRIKNGQLLMFDILANYINDAMRQAGLEQLQDPKWPSQYIEQYMEDKRDEWNPARVDTTGIPRKYFAERYIKHNVCPRRSVDSLCWDYVNRIRFFQIYEKIGEEQGITPQEALYNQVKNDFYFQGYKDFYYMISYALKHEDELLLVALREFVKNHPDYEVPKQSRDFFEEAHQFVESNR